MRKEDLLFFGLNIYEKSYVLTLVPTHLITVRYSLTKINFLREELKPYFNPNFLEKDPFTKIKI